MYRIKLRCTSFAYKNSMHPDLYRVECQGYYLEGQVVEVCLNQLVTLECDYVCTGVLTDYQDLGDRLCRIELVSPLSYLNGETLSRRFQNHTVVDIIQKITRPYVEFETVFELEGQYEVLLSELQYQQTDLEFLEYLCRKHGLYFYMHANAPMKLQFRDRAPKATTIGKTLESVECHHMLTLGAVAWNVVTRETCLPNHLTLCNADHEAEDKPVDVTISSFAVGMLCEVGTAWPSELWAKQSAQRYADAIEAEGMTYELTTNELDIVLGDRLKLKQNTGEVDVYVIALEVRYRACHHAFQNQLICIPVTVHFAWDWVRQTPDYLGYLPAMIRSDSGDPDIDVYGRYRIQYDFEKKSNHNTQRVFKAQSLSGLEYGMHAPLRDSVPVVVGHVLGDRTRPYILNALPMVKVQPFEYDVVWKSHVGHELRFYKQGCLALSTESQKSRLKFTPATQSLSVQASSGLLSLCAEDQVDVRAHQLSIVSNHTVAFKAQQTMEYFCSQGALTFSINSSMHVNSASQFAVDSGDSSDVVAQQLTYDAGRTVSISNASHAFEIIGEASCLEWVSESGSIHAACEIVFKVGESYLRLSEDGVCLKAAQIQLSMDFNSRMGRTLQAIQ